MANSYEMLPVPGYSAEYGQYDSPELLFSENGGFTQLDATLKGGQGVLLLGTILSQDGTGKYVKYGTAGAGPAEGFLRRSADTGAAGAVDQLCNLVVAGMVKLELVSAAHGGTVPAAALTDMDARTSAARSYIRL